MKPEEQEDQEDLKVRRDLQAIARSVERQIPFGWGFIVLVFNHGEGGRMNYVSDSRREDVVRAMYEFIAATKEGWAEHEPPLDEAALDSALGRARQRVAELEGYLAEAEKILKEAEARIKELEAEKT